VEYGKNDRYGRILGKVLPGDENMNLEQVRAGLAWHYKEYQGEQTTADRVKFSDTKMGARRHERVLRGDLDPCAAVGLSQGSAGREEGHGGFHDQV
jgi:endonuclease YncB( thermonuclease family)